MDETAGAAAVGGIAGRGILYRLAARRVRGALRYALSGFRFPAARTVRGWRSGPGVGR